MSKPEPLPDPGSLATFRERACRWNERRPRLAATLGATGIGVANLALTLRWIDAAVFLGLVLGALAVYLGAIGSAAWGDRYALGRSGRPTLRLVAPLPRQTTTTPTCGGIQRDAPLSVA